MKQFLLFLVFFLPGAAGLLAQDTIPFYDNFDNSSNFWTATPGATAWEKGTPAYGLTNSAHSAPNAWDVNLDTICGNNANCSLTSPLFVFTGITDATLSFWVNYKCESNYDGVRLEYSLNGLTWNSLGVINDPLATNWYNHLIYSSGLPSWTGNSLGWKKCTYKLSQFNNAASVYFRFIYTSDGSGGSDGFSMDDFRISLPILQSVTMVSITSPNSGCSLATETITTKLKNTGLAAISGGLTMGRRLGNGLIVIETIPGTILPGDTLTYTFTTQVNFPVSLSDSTYSLKVWAHLTGDPDLTDDTLTKTILSKKTPDPPLVNNPSILSGTVALLTATSNFPLSWYDLPLGGTLLSNQPTYTTPILYCKTTYYVEATGPSGCKSARVADTVYISNAVSIDGRTLVVQSPSSGYALTNHEVVKALFKNLGCQTIQNFTASFKLDTLPVVSELVTQAILNNTNYQFTFNATIDLSVYGNHFVKVWLSVPGDTNQTNDTVEFIVTNFHAFYCNSQASSTYDCDIGNVTISNLNNGSGYPTTYNVTSNHTYTNFLTSVPAIQLYRGHTYQVSVSPIWQEESYYARCKIFIDWNNNSLFDVATETAFMSVLGYKVPFTGTITVPEDALQGDIRFRVVMEENYDSSAIVPCGSYDRGETEDYTATIIIAPPKHDAALLEIQQPPDCYHVGDAFVPRVIIKNMGTDTLQNLILHYRIDNNAYIISPMGGNLFPGHITTIYFPSIIPPSGNHVIKAYITMVGDTIPGNDTLYKNIQGLPIYSIPYIDSFDGTNFTYYTHAITTGTSWIKGSPQPGMFPMNGAHSSPNVWATNLGSGSYDANANCELSTSDFQLVNGYTPQLSFWFTTQTDTLADGFHIEYSTDHGNHWDILDSYQHMYGWNWYPNSLSSNNQAGWSGRRPWTQAIYHMFSFPDPNGTIRFKFVFTSNGSGSTGGVAIDDFKLIFTQSTDPGITAIIYPHQPLVTGNNSFVGFRFVTFGINSQYLLPASYQVNNGPIISQNFSMFPPITTMEHKDLTFTSQFVIPAGDFTVKVFIQEPLDQNHFNDTLVYQYHAHYVCQDVGVYPDTALFSPPLSATNTIYVCPNAPFHVAAKGLYPENNLLYAQHDTTSVFEWDFGDGNIQFGRETDHSYVNGDTYRIRMKIKDVNDCESSFVNGPLVIVATNPVSYIHTITPLCSNNQNTVTIGYSDTNTIKLTSQLGAITLQQQLSFDSAVYIPDGGSSSVNWYSITKSVNLFNANAVLSQASDIESVCVNLEHSYMGDLDITLKCPSGQTAILKSYNGSGGAYLGIPLGGANHAQFDCSAPPACLLDPAQNPPGTGWTYCFSMSAQHGVLNNYSSTNGSIANGSYQPSQSYASLIGCPLNGDWTLKVSDHYNTDNGWVFNWLMNLNPSIIPDLSYLEPPFDTVYWSGPNIMEANSNHMTVQPPIGGTYAYQVFVTNSLGCTFDTTFFVSAFENFQVDCGPDINLPAPSFANLSAHPIGALLPATYSWSTGETTADITVSPYNTTTYTVTVVDASGCSATDSIKITIGGCPMIEGHIYYDNVTQTPITTTPVSLQLNNVQVSDTMTNNSGDYILPNICQPGNYNILVNCNKPNGGYNAADALKAVNYFVGNTNLSTIQREAADVDLSAVINAADALQIMKRFVGLSNSFPAGDWVFENDIVNIGQYFNITKNIKGLCAGDVDKSFIPGMKSSPAVELTWLSDILNTSIDKAFELPVYVDVKDVYHALSLIIIYDHSQVNIEKLIPNPKLVKGGQSVFIYNLVDNELRIAWYSLADIIIPEDESLFSLILKLKSSAGSFFSVSGNSAFADVNSKTIEGARLMIPKVAPLLNENTLSVYPNPASGKITIHYSLLMGADVDLIIYNSLGQSTIVMPTKAQQPGSYTLPYSLLTLNPGVYSVQLGIKTIHGYTTNSVKLIVQ